MGILKVIEWTDNSSNTIVYKVDLKNNNVNKGSMVTVRDSQVCIFADKGRMADVFLPGTYKLDTSSLPIITTLLSWKYGFEHPYKSDIYFVSTKQFTNQKWGTQNPIMLRDKEYGPIRVRAYGTYAFKVDDAFVFMKEISGTCSSYKTEEITNYLRSKIVTMISDAIAEAGLPVLDMAANLLELGDIVAKNLNKKLIEQYGIKVTDFNFENFSLPDNLQAILDEQMRLGVMGKNIDTYTRLAQADALKTAAANPGMGSTMGAGMGMGMGMAMGQMFGGNMTSQQQPQNNNAQANTVKCPKCNADVKSGAKFCPECGSAIGLVCPKCKASLPMGTKFCPECGTKIASVCKKCGAELAPGAKFCPECGEKQ